MIPHFLAIAAVIIILCALILAVRAAQRQFKWGPELSRKSVHVVMGLVCLTFPWIFHEAWPVWLLAGIASAGLGATRLIPALKKQFGQVLCGIDRESWGEMLFPLAVAFVYWLAHGNLLLFLIPILTLTLADAVAALIGRRYGLAKYETDDGWKSIEGSAAFFFVAFLSTHMLLLLASDIGRPECILISIIMGLILMLMEAIAWRGLDNLFIPLVSYVFLKRFSSLTTYGLEFRLVILICIILGFLYWRKSTRLTQSAVIGSALVLYTAWAVGDIHWLIAPLVTVAGYTFLCQQSTDRAQRHTIHAIACIGGVGLFWLCLSQVMATGNPIYAYGVAYGSNLGMIALAHFASCPRIRRLTVAVFLAVLLAYVPMAAAYLIVWRANPDPIRLSAGAFLILLLTVSSFAVWQPSVRNCPADFARWTRQGTISAIGSTIAFMLISILEPWSRSFR
jgi:phytol kinase